MSAQLIDAKKIMQRASQIKDERYIEHKIELINNHIIDSAAAGNRSTIFKEVESFLFGATNEVEYQSIVYVICDILESKHYDVNQIIRYPCKYVTPDVYVIDLEISW